MSDTRTHHPAYVTFTGLADALGVTSALDAVAERWPELDRNTCMGLAVAWALPQARNLGGQGGQGDGARVLDRDTPATRVVRCMRLLDAGDHEAWRRQFGPDTGPLSDRSTWLPTERKLMDAIGLLGNLGAAPHPEDTDEIEQAAREGWAAYDEQAHDELCQAYREAWHAAYAHAVTSTARRLARTRSMRRPWHEDVTARDLMPGDLIQAGVSTNYTLAAAVDIDGDTVAVTIYDGPRDGDKPRDEPTLFYRADQTVTLSVFYRDSDKAR